MNIQKNISLAPYTTFKIGGPAEYFADVKEVGELQEVLKWAKENKQPVKIIGGGSNMLVSDNGLKGLSLKLSLENLEFEENKLIAETGVIMALLLNKSLAQGLVGLEFVSGIPGTLGGAIRGNAGTYGVAMDSVVTKIKYLDENFELQEMDNKSAGFSYRHSIFKEKSWIIVGAELRLETGDIKESRKLIMKRLKHRQDTQPNLPSAGCIFKNVHFDEVDIERLRALRLDIDKFAKLKKIPSAYLIERTGLKGHKIGDAQISKMHANYIVNTGSATSDQVVMLISFIKQQVRDKYGVQLREEVQLLV